MHLGDHPRTKHALAREREGRSQAENSLINISETLSLQLLGPPRPTTFASRERRMGKEKEIKLRKQI